MRGSLSSNGSGFARRKPPPDYTQRSVKLRIFLCLAAIMAVVSVLERSRDPETRQWFWGGGETGKAALDNRRSETGRTAHDPADMFVAESDSKSAPAADSQSFDPVERAWRVGWQEVLPRLPMEQQDALFEILYARRSERQVSREGTNAAAELVRSLTEQWREYQTIAAQSVTDLPEADRAAWMDVLRQVDDRLSNTVLPALAAAADKPQITDAQRQSLEDLETTLVKVARGAIQDDTPVFRPAEREIWFHELGRVRDASAEALARESLGEVAYLQLHKQAAEYRGKVLSLKGTARLAYRAPAPMNYLGVKEYFVYFVQPAGAPTSAIWVYTLDVPVGFPRIGSFGGDPAGKVREEIEVTGVFFKRCAYPAEGGTYTAPVILANAVRWKPEVSVTAKMPLGPLELAGAAVAALLVTICLAAVIWKRTSHSHGGQRQQSPGILDVGGLALGPTTEEKLREMERRAGGEA
jgi:hypothetical protein